MKLVFCVTRSDTIGGAQIHVADMSSWLIDRGHSVLVVVGGEGLYCNELSRRSIPYRSVHALQRNINIWRDACAFRELRAIFQAESPDLISLHSTKAGTLGRLASIGLPHSVIFTAHGWSFTEGVPKIKAIVYRNLEKRIAMLADRIITVSNYDRNLALRCGVGSTDKLVTIHNAMHDTKCKANAYGESGVPRIVMVARLNEQKDHATLFHALSQIRETQWHLDLVGDGPLESVLRELAVELEIDDRVAFLGLRNDVADILARANIFVLSTNWEGFPRSILEAMRAGLPVVVTNVGGAAEAVRDGEIGFVVNAKNVEALASRIKYLLERPNERLRMGKNGRERFEREFVFERMASETFDTYVSVLGSGTFLDD